MASLPSRLPPPQRPTARLTQVEQDLSADAITSFTVAIGGRDALMDTLAIAGGTPEIDHLHTLLVDPVYAHKSLRYLCTAAGLTIADLFSAYKKALLVKAHLEATKVVTDKLVGVVADVMDRAQPQTVTCSTCQGTCTFTPEPSKRQPTPEPIPCPTCKATGTITRYPELDRQKVALELGQLLSGKTGPLVQQNMLQIGGGSSSSLGAGALESLQQVVQEALYPRARLTAATASQPLSVDAEILPSSQEST